MSPNELVQWCKNNGVSPDKQIALRAKDDYFVTPDDVLVAIPYFGNSNSGENWMAANAKKDGNGDVDYDHPDNSMIILDTGRG